MSGEAQPSPSSWRQDQRPRALHAAISLDRLGSSADDAVTRTDARPACNPPPCLGSCLCRRRSRDDTVDHDEAIKGR